MDDLFKTSIEFEWDHGNINKNWVKHKINTKESEDVFFDKWSFTTKDVKHSGLEDRFQILGKTEEKKYLTVYYTMRGHKIRIISARPMSKKERIKYDKIKKQKKNI